MPKFRPRTKQQNAALHSLLNKLGFTPDDKAEMVFDITGGRTDHSSEMSFDEANRMIHRLGGEPLLSPKAKLSRVSVNRYRQNANVPQIVTPEHLNKMQREWHKNPHRTAEGLTALCRQILKDPEGNPLDAPRTTAECNKVIEAVKSMNSRAKTSRRAA